MLAIYRKINNNHHIPPYHFPSHIVAELCKFQWWIRNIMQQHNRHTKFCRIPHKRRNQQKSGKQVMHNHLVSILHLWLKEDGNGGEDVVASFEGVVGEDAVGDTAVWVGHVVVERVPEPVELRLNCPDSKGHKESYSNVS